MYEIRKVRLWKFGRKGNTDGNTYATDLEHEIIDLQNNYIGESLQNNCRSIVRRV